MECTKVCFDPTNTLLSCLIECREENLSFNQLFRMKEGDCAASISLQGKKSSKSVSTTRGAMDFSTLITNYLAIGDEASIALYDVSQIVDETGRKSGTHKPLHLLANKHKGKIFTSCMYQVQIILIKPVLVAFKFSGPITEVFFNPIAKALVASSSVDDGTIVFHDIQSGKIIQTIVLPPFEANMQGPSCFQFHSDGVSLAIGSNIGIVSLYDLRKCDSPSADPATSINMNEEAPRFKNRRLLPVSCLCFSSHARSTANVKRRTPIKTSPQQSISQTHQQSSAYTQVVFDEDPLKNSSKSLPQCSTPSAQVRMYHIDESHEDVPEIPKDDVVMEKAKTESNLSKTIPNDTARVEELVSVVPKLLVELPPPNEDWKATQHNNKDESIKDFHLNDTDSLNFSYRKAQYDRIRNELKESSPREADYQKESSSEFGFLEQNEEPDNSCADTDLSFLPIDADDSFRAIQRKVSILESRYNGGGDQIDESQSATAQHFTEQQRTNVSSNQHEPNVSSSNRYQIHIDEIHRSDPTNFINNISSQSHQPTHSPATLVDMTLLKQMLEDSKADIREVFHQELVSLHIDMLRQFQDLSDEMENRFQHQNEVILHLLSDNQKLLQENERLRNLC